jgi:hypothetical protein
MLAGVLSTGVIPLKIASLIQILSLWLLVDPILGALWELVAVHNLWRSMIPVHLPSPPRCPMPNPGQSPGGW